MSTICPTTSCRKEVRNIRETSRPQTALVDDSVNVEHLLGAIDRIKDSPVADSVLVQAGEICIDDFMTEVVDVGGDPFGFLEEPLGDRLPDGFKIMCNGFVEGQPIPSHVRLPSKIKSFGNLFA